MADDFVVTPWEVHGDVDYDRLICTFGTEKIDKRLLDRMKKHTGDLHYFLRRGIFFSHRDMHWLLDQYEKGNPFFLYTGRGPSGNTHFGHLIPWMFTKWLQDKFGCDLWFQMTDDEKFVFKQDLTLEQCHEYAYENALDLIALGFDPKKTKILIDTDHANLMYKEALRVAKKITFSTAKATFGFTNDSNLGQIFYTSMQAVPAFLPSVLAGKNIPCLIPYAIDQDAHFRVARDVIPRLGYYKPAAIHCRFLPALTGSSGKMSTTNGEDATIFTTDDEKTVRSKIMKYAFSGGKATLEEHRKLGGNPEIDASYQWLTYLEEDDSKLQQIHADYKSGKLLSGELKQILVDKVNTFLKHHQAEREKARKKLHQFLFKG